MNRASTAHQAPVSTLGPPREAGQGCPCLGREPAAVAAGGRQGRSDTGCVRRCWGEVGAGAKGQGVWGYHLSKVGNRPADLGSGHAATCGQAEAGVCWRNKGGGRNEARAKSSRGGRRGLWPRTVFQRSDVVCSRGQGARAEARRSLQRQVQ